jgi:dihydrofolate reductase
MRKIIVNTYVSLDGVIEDPAWTMPYWNDEISDFQGESFDASDTLLLGRITYEGFAASWPHMEESEGESAVKMNSMPKYVASRTLTSDQMEWNATLLEGDVVEEVKKIKQQPGGNLLMYASPTFMDTLMEHNLIDEYRFVVYPVVLGKGKRLFKDGASATLKLVETRTFSTGVVALRYEPGEQD